MKNRSAIQLKRRPRRGIAYALALVLLALCTSPAVAMSASTNLSLRRGDNLHAAMNAQLAAESGLEFAVRVMDGIQSAPYWDEYAPDMMPVVYAALQAKLGQTPNLDGQSPPGTNPHFKNCTFQGKIVTAVPREFWYTKNALTFIGESPATGHQKTHDRQHDPKFVHRGGAVTSR